jgi:hypothetical protein
VPCWSLFTRVPRRGQPVEKPDPGAFVPHGPTLGAPDRSVEARSGRFWTRSSDGEFSNRLMSSWQFVNRGKRALLAHTLLANTIVAGLHS